jgi:phosphatidylserine decarboxylase
MLTQTLIIFAQIPDLGYNAHPNFQAHSTMKKLSVLIQYLTPQRALTSFAGWLSESRWKWLKTWEINYFIRKYNVNVNDAVKTNLDDYPTFNSFFTRYLKPELRPIANEQDAIVSPADGSISQLGEIKNDLIFQAKGFDYSLTTLLAGDQNLAKEFNNGIFATIYLSPKDYHRVHMPLTGKLKAAIYVPGNLFSVSQATAEGVRGLFARNERLISIFETEAGPMAVILVGAMLVGSINTVWEGPKPARSITRQNYSGNITLERGAEMGHFKMGSTAIVLFAKNKAHWNQNFNANTVVRMGELLGKIEQP